MQIKPTLLYGNQTIYEKIYHRLVTLYQEKTGVQKLLIDWSNSTVREGAGTPESQRKLGAIPQKVAKSTVIKKFKVMSRNLKRSFGTIYLRIFTERQPILLVQWGEKGTY